MSLYDIWGEGAEKRLKDSQKKRAIKSWSDSEIEYMLKHYYKKSPKQIAEDLGRTRTGILTRANVLRKAGLMK